MAAGVDTAVAAGVKASAVSEAAAATDLAGVVGYSGSMGGITVTLNSGITQLLMNAVASAGAPFY